MVHEQVRPIRVHHHEPVALLLREELQFARLPVFEFPALHFLLGLGTQVLVHGNSLGAMVHGLRLVVLRVLRRHDVDWLVNIDHLGLAHVTWLPQARRPPLLESILLWELRHAFG